jgi:Family of unknown function (DUF6152)
MRRRLPWLLTSGVWLATCATTAAHHSAAMFDAENPIELVGTVREFKYTSPHTFIFLEVKETGGGTKVWTLEGNAPSNLVREGWLHDTLKLGDEIKLTVQPLRSGAPGGAWNASRIKFKDGRPVVLAP